MKTKLVLIDLIGVLIFVSMINIVSAEMMVSDAGVEYEKELLESLNNQTLAENWINQSDYEIFKIDEQGTIWAHEVIVRLKDNSGIVVEGSIEEKKKLMKQRDEWFKPIVEEVLSTLSEDEFRSYGKSSDGFGGQITKEGVDKLIKNKNVRKISWPKTIPRIFSGLEDSKVLYGFLIFGVTISILIILIIYFIVKRKKKKR